MTSVYSGVSSLLPPDHETPSEVISARFKSPESRNHLKDKAYGSPHFSERSIFRQMREDPRRLLSASVQSQITSA